MASNRLNEILTVDGWKFSEFAKKADISTSYLGKIRRQKRTPSDSLQNRIVIALNNNSRRSDMDVYTVESVFPKG